MSLKDLAEMLCDKVEFKQGDGTWTVDVLSIQGVDSMTCGGTLIRYNGRWEKIDDSITDVFRKCYAAFNPPGPGDVTVDQIREAIKELPPDEDDDYVVSISDNGCCILGCGEEILAHSNQFNGDILATIASLKPAPAPRDELQKSHDRLLRRLRLYHEAISEDMENVSIKGKTGEILIAAEKLKEKP